MRTIQRRIGTQAFCLTLTCACVVGGRIEAAAQMPPTANAPRAQNAVPSLSVEEVKARLQKPVHLMLGDVTLPQLTAALSAQTGLRVEAAEYLRERKLVVQLEGASASAALSALGELNDWTWSDKGGGRIVIARKLPLLRQEPETVPLRVRAALPKDIRAFCRIGPVYDHASQATTRDAQGNDNDGSGLFRPSILAADLREKLAASLQPGILNGAEISWKRLTATQQQYMTGILLFDALNLTSSVMHGDPPPFLADPTRAFLEMQGSTLSVMTRPTPDVRRGFGAGIKPRREGQ